MKIIRMINKFKYLLLGAVLAVGLAFSLPHGEESKKDKVIVNLVYNVLNTSHFAPQVINDEFSVTAVVATALHTANAFGLNI